MGTYENTMLKLEQMAQSNTALGQQWQERMSNTSHQREVADLVAAGLNPVLSSGGSGAQSYTTNVDSAVNGIAGMASAREGANATRYAAKQSAAATRAAAAAQLEAARIAAGASERNNIRSNETAKWQTINQSPSNIIQAIDKATRNIGLQDAVSSSKVLKGSVSAVSQILNDPAKFAKNMQGLGKDYSSMGVKGQNMIKNALKKIGLDTTWQFQKMYYNAIFGNSGTALASLLKAIDRKNNSATAQWLRSR